MGLDAYGLMGLADGIKQGFQTYQDAKKNKEQKDYQNAILQRQLANDAAQVDRDQERSAIDLTSKGLMRTDTGFDFSPLEKAKREAELEKLKAETEYTRKGKANDALSEMTKGLQLQKMQMDMADKAREKTPGGRLEKLGADTKQKVGFVAGALQNITNYEDAYRGGQRQGFLSPDTPILGRFKNSTPIDDARIGATEAIGRLQSGGAIGKQEEARFMKMLPTAADDDATSARKLQQIRKELELKLTAYGFQPDQLEDIGFDSKALGYGTESANLPNRGLVRTQKSGGGIIPEAQASETKVIGGKTYKKVAGGWEEQ